MQTEVTIVGASISACMCAAYLKIKNPSWQVNMIGRTDQSHPIVGESLTEYSTYLLHELGLGSYLEDNHYHKNGLTFYFKEDIDNPQCRRYAVHEAIAIPPMPANLINRFDFDKVIHNRCLELGVRFIEGRATDLRFDGEKRYEVSYKAEGGPGGVLRSDFLIDASGRNRWLARRLNLPKKEPVHQRCCFWFWVADFDRRTLSNIEAVKKRQHSYDSYYVTHHYMGKGFWNWVIPITSGEYRDFVSVGITWHPKHMTAPITNIEQYKEHLAKEHPAVRDYVESGKVIKTNFYNHYMYECDHLYSPEGWFLLGDAGDTVDPLYSTGLVMSSLQSTQINEMINLKLRGELDEQAASDFQGAFKAIKNALQGEIGDLYSVMHDPYQCQWRIHFSSTLYFFSLLPLWLCRFMTNREGARWITGFIARRREPYMNLLSLLQKASERLGKIDVSTIPNLYDRSVDWALRGPNEKNLEKNLARMYLLFAQYRFRIFRDSGYADPLNQIRYIAGDLWRAFYSRFLFSFKPFIRKEDSAAGFELTGEPEEFVKVNPRPGMEQRQDMAANM